MSDKDLLKNALSVIEQQNKIIIGYEKLITTYDKIFILFNKYFHFSLPFMKKFITQEQSPIIKELQELQSRLKVHESQGLDFRAELDKKTIH